MNDIPIKQHQQEHQMPTETKTPHPHASMMAQYAADAAETDTPWERWQNRQAGEDDWYDLTGNPGWSPVFKYRRKPATSAFPEPEPQPTGREPFDLEKFKVGRDALTRNGGRVKFGAYNPDAAWRYRVVGWLDGEAGSWSEEGSYVDSDASPFDLIAMAPETRVLWLNIYPHDDAYGYHSKDTADRAAGDDRLGGKAYRVEVEL